MGFCERCQGNGEVVVDWGKYLHPRDRAEEERSVQDCPDCDGRGAVLCEGCPPEGYPTDETRCLPCPRRPADHVEARS